LPKGVIANPHEHRNIIERMEAGARGRWNKCDLVFPAQTGGPVDPARINVALHKDLRRSTATLLLEEGTHPKIVQDLLEHSMIAMALDLYGHATPRLQDEATAKLQETLFDTGSDEQANKKNRRRRRDSH
jgi:integrase